MLTEKIDRGLDALEICRRRVLDFRDIFRPQSPERIALDRLLEALAEAEAALAADKA